MGRRAKSISKQGQSVQPGKKLKSTAQAESKHSNSTCYKPSYMDSNEYVSNLFKSPSVDWTALVPNKQVGTLSSTELSRGQILPVEDNSLSELPTGQILPVVKEIPGGQILPVEEDSLPGHTENTDKTKEPQLVPSQNKDSLQKLLAFFFGSNSLLQNPDSAAQDLDNLCEEFNKIALKHYPHYVSFDQNSAHCQQCVHSFMVCSSKTMLYLICKYKSFEVQVSYEIS